jgi:hypothetical protein
MNVKIPAWLRWDFNRPKSDMKKVRQRTDQMIKHQQLQKELQGDTAREGRKPSAVVSRLRERSSRSGENLPVRAAATGDMAHWCLARVSNGCMGSFLIFRPLPQSDNSEVVGFSSSLSEL